MLRERWKFSRFRTCKGANARGRSFKFPPGHNTREFREASDDLIFADFRIVETVKPGNVELLVVPFVKLWWIRYPGSVDLGERRIANTNTNDSNQNGPRIIDIAARADRSI